MLESYYNLSLSLLYAGFKRVESWWNYQDVVSPFYRLYYISKGEGRIHMNQTSYTLSPGELFLIPKFVSHSYECRDYMEHYYICFFDDIADGKGVNNPLLMKFQVPAEEIEAAAEKLDDGLKEAVRTAAGNIRRFHEAQKTEDVTVETMPGVICRQKNIPIDRVGLYIPGGTAPLFSTVLMLAVPATIAGCGKVILCTPAGPQGKVSPAILYAADVCGITEIYKVGGAVAVGAMAYGTGTVPKVDKIFGPGNSFVTEAKQQVSQDCAIDMPAGPSEVMIMADESAVPAFVASDFLCELELQYGNLKRKSIIDASILKSAAVLLSSEDEMAEFANYYAPEHLIIATRNYQDTVEKIRNAGSVFLGNYSTESAGDYASGTNHTLPTSGWAVSCSGVNLSAFMKKMTIQEISRSGLELLGPVIEKMAMAEGLDAHANAVRVRLER